MSTKGRRFLSLVVDVTSASDGTTLAGTVNQSRVAASVKGNTMLASAKQERPRSVEMIPCQQLRSNTEGTKNTADESVAGTSSFMCVGAKSAILPQTARATVHKPDRPHQSIHM